MKLSCLDMPFANLVNGLNQYFSRRKINSAAFAITGTPIQEFFGAKPTGKSFNTMALDLFTVKNGKLARAYHVENWIGALEQINQKHIADSD